MESHKKTEISIREPAKGLMVIMLTAQKVHSPLRTIKEGSLIFVHPENKKPYLLFTENDELYVTELEKP